jgi:hypothetical protein
MTQFNRTECLNPQIGHGYRFFQPDGLVSYGFKLVL